MINPIEAIKYELWKYNLKIELFYIYLKVRLFASIPSIFKNKPDENYSTQKH